MFTWSSSFSASYTWSGGSNDSWTRKKSKKSELNVTGLKHKKRPADGPNPARIGRTGFYTLCPSSPEPFPYLLYSGLEMVTDKKIDQIPMAEGGRQSGKKKE
jgi:hypothetical protein